MGVTFGSEGGIQRKSSRPKDTENCGLDFGFPHKDWTIERGKKKKSFGRENDKTKRRGHRSSIKFHLHTQEGQDFSAAAAAAYLITHMSSESRTMDLTNNGMVNHYLRDVDHGSHCLPSHRTTCFTYMSE
jgi:hypothetical protein